MEPQPRKRGGLIGGGVGAQAVVLTVGVLSIALLIALVTLIMRDVVRQLPAPEDARELPVNRPSVDASVSSAPDERAGSREWITENDYPLDAIRAGLQGTVTIALEIAGSGYPTACRITKSSGHAMLDEATCKALMKRARFPRKFDAAGFPVATQISRRVRWVLPE